MRISELEQALAEARAEYGDLEIAVWDNDFGNFNGIECLTIGATPDCADKQILINDMYSDRRDAATGLLNYDTATVSEKR